MYYWHRLRSGFILISCRVVFKPKIREQTEPKNLLWE